MPDPTPVSHADYLLVESTYGDRVRDGEDAEEALAEVVARTTARGGTVIIPAFAVLLNMGICTPNFLLCWSPHDWKRTRSPAARAQSIRATRAYRVWKLNEA